jgi:D-serine deaminase-like pyridoxal phosphate-dependent protein
MLRNIDRLSERMRGLGVTLRPHLKTCKNIEIARLMMASDAGPATVSTLSEAEAFAAAGVKDITYAVGIAPAKLDRIRGLRRQGIDITVILDSVEQARVCRDVPALIEIDSDGHRAGVRPAERERLLEIAAALGPESLRGVLTHAGGSYHAHGAEALAAAAEGERKAAVEAAGILRSAGYATLVVSVGSTPTAHFARDLSGVTEVRAGVYVFFDVMMAELGVCSYEDIAISVLATVIGQHHERGVSFIDAGWMALSRDLGFGNSGNGLVCDAEGKRLDDCRVIECSQEHGVVNRLLPLGTQIRILPNHACATAAQFAGYQTPEGSMPRVATGAW